jgi:predicted NUDIX family phosphoesterase
MAHSEKVLVIPASKFHQLGYFQGFSTEVSRYIPALLQSENISFRPRSEVETDTDFKQLIPYMIFCHTKEQGELRIFRYVRGKGMGENRLHSKASVGIGGHISQEDTFPEGTDQEKCNDGMNVFRTGMLRELAEEVQMNSKFTEKCVGMINDDETDVGKVHLGVVYRFDLETPDIISNEPDLIESGFLPLSTLLADLSQFETWSSISLKSLFQK